jgi:biopolymer transport protein ExbD
MAAKLAGIFAGREQKVTFVKADPSIEYAAVAEVIDMGPQASTDSMGLLASEIESGR